MSARAIVRLRDVYQGLVDPMDDAPRSAARLQQRNLPNGPLLDTQYLNFAPRLGISYSPTPKLVIRTGYGIFYTQDIGNAYFDMARNIAGRVTSNKPNSTAPYGNSNLTWANAAPGAAAVQLSNLGPTTAFVERSQP